MTGRSRRWLSSHISLSYGEMRALRAPARTRTYVCRAQTGVMRALPKSQTRWWDGCHRSLSWSSGSSEIRPEFINGSRGFDHIFWFWMRRTSSAADFNFQAGKVILGIKLRLFGFFFFSEYKWGSAVHHQVLLRGFFFRLENVFFKGSLKFYRHFKGSSCNPWNAKNPGPEFPPSSVCNATSCQIVRLVRL